MLYNFLDVYFQRFDDLKYIEKLLYKLPKDKILEFLKNNQKRVLKNHIIEEINSLVDKIRKHFDVPYFDKDQNMEQLINLIEIREIELAKRVFDIANKYKFTGAVDHRGYSFKQYLIQILVNQKDNVFNILLSLIGEDYFVDEFNILVYGSNTLYIKKLLNILIRSKKYDLFMRILNSLIRRDYKGSREVINMMLPRLTKAIELNNNNLLVKYLNILNLALDEELKLDKNGLLNIDNLIKETQQDEL